MFEEKKIKNNMSNQSKLFDSFSDQFIESIDEKYVSDFRKKTIYNYMFKDMDLNNKKVLDLGFGTGTMTRYLKKKYNNIDVYGFDISNKLVENYNKYFHGKGSVVDITSNDYSEIIENYRGFFDCVIALGIIHHCHNNLQVAINNITYLVKKNGTLITHDPNKKYILNPIREIWYKYDKKYFSSMEEKALSVNEVKDYLTKSGKKFEFLDSHFHGGIGYFLINCGMVLRMNKTLKKIIYYPSLLIDLLTDKIQISFLQAAFILKIRLK